jgi:chromosome segregation protein
MANARLTALRLVGFKSFAEKTVVEFGPGISAVVGPNGSGKSNLADALRWTLGEQGRMLRTRRSEDVIFAGSSSRRAIGMADVTLVVDNGDRLLPVDFAEVEIGRRLYRSGESEYLLNRQRIRLRDLTELLDAGNLADNAFLFIGQGMVDQALALRPEERRPLFEEAAGVRRHERRRRQAEAELAEAEQNLDRLRDVLAELRPQAKRLAAQAEQLQARRTAGVELAEGLLAAARAKWRGASQVASQQQKAVDRARAAADAALSTLKSAEEESATLSMALSKRAETERKERDGLDSQRALLTERRVALARIESETASLERERERAAGELAGVETRSTDASRVLAEIVMPAVTGVAAELEMIERQIAELEPSANASDAAAQLRARSAELEQQMRRRDATAEAQAGARSRADDLARRLLAAEQERDAAAAAAQEARAVLDEAQSAAAAAQQAVDSAAAGRSAAHERMAAAEAELAAARATVAALEAVLGAGDDGLARAARARGGTRLGEGLELDAKLRTAVAAALGAAAAAYLVDEASVEPLAGRRGTVAVRGVRAQPATAGRDGTAIVEAAIAAGGGPLNDAVLRDPQTDVTRLVGRVVWLPTIASALALRPQLPPGWRAVTVAGEVVDDQGVISLAAADSILDRRAEKEAAERSVAELDARLAADREDYERSRQAATAAIEAARATTGAVAGARQEARRAEEIERVAQRRAEQLLREHSWEESQAQRLSADLTAADSLVTRLLSDVDRLRAEAEGIAKADGAQDRSVLRLQLTGRRDELRRQRDEQAVAARAAEEARRRAELTLAMDDSRRTQLDADLLRIGDRLAQLASQRDELAAAVAEGEERVRAASVQLEALLAAGADERARLVAAERAAMDSRDKLRQAESASRQAEITSMEARLQLDQTREQLLVELATIGADALLVLRSAAGSASEPQPSDEEPHENAAETLEELLETVMEDWRSGASGEEQPPSQGRLASLRRRFNELGAGNPFAVEEYAELRDRLDSLETQRADMETAIDNTRELIASLSQMINEQFRTTFAALEDAFERRFHELFGGGDAELSLTSPEDISATGIEIHARPPGKKRQPLSMLSGGERALTAVSLLLAMLEVRPVPFCVLDEVDAALDEANVGRFARALRGLSDQTQFIVITHNRGTIEGADALYGVTIGDDAVSRVVSLRLPDAAKNGREPAIDDTLAEAALA